MTTINIQSKVVDSDTCVNLDLVSLDGQTFFHIHGMKYRLPIDHRVPVDESQHPCKYAQELYDHYVDMFRFNKSK